MALKAGNIYTNHGQMSITTRPRRRERTARWRNPGDRVVEVRSEICEGDQDLVDGLQLWVGASVYRGHPVNKFHVLYGDGPGSVKSTFVNTASMAALGDYANSADPSIFTAQRGSQHPVMLRAIHRRPLYGVLPERTGERRSTFRRCMKAVTGSRLEFVPSEMHGRPQTVKPNATALVHGRTNCQRLRL